MFTDSTQHISKLLLLWDVLNNVFFLELLILAVDMQAIDFG